jgi:hypothetical protein
MALRVVGVGAGIAVVSGVIGLLTFGRRRRLTAAQIMKLDDAEFKDFLHSTGLDARVEEVMARRRRVAS